MSKVWFINGTSKGFGRVWAAQHAQTLPAYDGARAAVAKLRSNFIAGDPTATGPAILKLVDAAAPPLRVFFGSGGLPMTRVEYAKRIETWEKWNDCQSRHKAFLRERNENSTHNPATAPTKRSNDAPAQGGLEKSAEQDDKSSQKPGVHGADVEKRIGQNMPDRK